MRLTETLRSLEESQETQNILETLGRLGMNVDPTLVATYCTGERLAKIGKTMLSGTVDVEPVHPVVTTGLLERTTS